MRIDARHRERTGKDHYPAISQEFHMSAGYVVPEGGAFSITTAGVDSEISATTCHTLIRLIPTMFSG